MGLAVSFDESFERDNRCNVRNISKKINTVQSGYDYKNIEKFVSRTDNDVHNFLEGGKNKNRKFSRLRATIEDWETCPRPILAGCSKIFLLSVRKYSTAENFVN